MGPAQEPRDRTLVFTDIEASTEHLRRLGPDFRALLERHRTLVRTAVESRGGHLVGWSGDGAFAVFDGAAAALHAVVQVLAAHASEPWPGGAAVLVRVGSHTGPVTAVRDPGGQTEYVGLAVHQAARVAGAAHGGQALVTGATVAAAGVAAAGGPCGLPAGIAVLDLGEHRLKDFPELVPLGQLHAPGLSAATPAPRSLSRSANNLPAERTAFVGRDAEVAALLRLVDAERLVTLLGPGGVGKTRTALEVAGARVPRMRDGVFLVPLDAVDDPRLVPEAVARALGLRPGGLRSDDADLTRVLCERLAEADVLLVVDNAEHVVDAVATLLDELLTRCRWLHALVTSREALHLPGETVWRLDPLAVPAATDGAPQESEAMQVFLAAARRGDPRLVAGPTELALAAQTCRDLDGLPLALELAAAQVGRQGIRAVAEHVGGLLAGPTLRRGGPARHRSLAAALDWSWQLLTPVQQTVLRRLAVGSGAGSAVLAAALCPDLADVETVLLDLADRSMLRLDDDGSWSLLRTVAEYAGECLVAAGEWDTVVRAHAAACAARCAVIEAQVLTPGRGAAVEESERLRPDLLLVLARAADGRLGLPGQAPSVRVCLSTLKRLWVMRSDLHETQAATEALLRPDHEAGAMALSMVAWLQMWTGSPGCRTSAAQTVRWARRLGDHHAEGEGWLLLGYLSLERGRYDLAGEALRRALAAAGLGGGLILRLNVMAIMADVHLGRGHVRCAQALLQAAQAEVEPTGNQQLLGQVDTRLAHVHERLGDLDLVVRHARRALERGRAAGYSATVSVDDAVLLVDALRRLGRAAEARAELVHALGQPVHASGGPPGYRALVALAVLTAIDEGLVEQACSLWSSAEAVLASGRRDEKLERHADAAAKALVRLGWVGPERVPAGVPRRMDDVVRAACGLLAGPGSA